MTAFDWFLAIAFGAFILIAFVDMFFGMME